MIHQLKEDYCCYCFYRTPGTATVQNLDDASRVFHASEKLHIYVIIVLTYNLIYSKNRVGWRHISTCTYVGTEILIPKADGFNYRNESYIRIPGSTCPKKGMLAGFVGYLEVERGGGATLAGL